MCKIFSSCYKPSRYTSSLLWWFFSVDVVLVLVQLVMLGFFIRLRKHQGISAHYKIFAAAIVALLARGLWYLMSMYYFYDDKVVGWQ